MSSPKLSISFDNDLMRRPKARGHHSVPSANSTNSSRRMPMSRVPRGPAPAGDGTLSSRSSQSIGRSEIGCSPVHDNKPLHRKRQFLVWAKRCRPQWGLSAAGQYWRALRGSAPLAIPSWQHIRIFRQSHPRSAFDRNERETCAVDVRRRKLAYCRILSLPRRD